MPRKKKTGPKPVEAITHDDKRTNLPTADAHEFVDPEMEHVPPFRAVRDRDLDPQLVWKGKDELDQSDLEVDAPPIYIQEKIDPRVIIENLRKTAKAGEQEPELTLFDTFDGLDDLSLVEFYEHEANWSNRMILGDSLQVMASLAEREALRRKVQMVYVDPPYGIDFKSNWQPRVDQREVRDGKIEHASREAEQIRAFRDLWELGIHSYLTYLRERLTVAKDLLVDSGSIVVQISDDNLHLVRSVLDEVFGRENYAGQIAFLKTSSQSTATIQSIFDVLLIYAKNIDALKYRPLLRPKVPGDEGAKQYTKVFSPDLSEYRSMTAAELADPSLVPDGWKIGRLGPVLSQGAQQGPRSEPYVWDDELIPIPANSHWKYDPTPGGAMDKLRSLGRLRRSGKSVATVLLLDENPTTPLSNVWLDTGTGSFTEDQIYVVQTAEKVVQRCVLMLTDPGDLVVDPTCGSGTTASVAEQWGRRWITTDTSRVALALARHRILSNRYPHYYLRDSAAGKKKESELLGVPLDASNVTDDIRHGFVNRRAVHVTLGNIAENPDLHAELSPDQRDAAILRHAEYEELIDQPYEDKSRVRVAGPFTVESLSPHRSLAFSSGEEPATARAADRESSGATFEQMVLENLGIAGIQNGRRNERLEFDLVEPYAGTYIQAIGTREEADEATPSRVGISIGPEYGTVGPKFIKNAAREAIKAGDIDLLCVLGFAFDPTALGSLEDDIVSSDEGFDVAAERKLGHVPVLLVRMNADLVMGEDLKKTGAGNLFTVFGEPDIELTETDGELMVEIKGVDVYDPTTGELRSNDTDQIALWMVDTDYNGESFFVRHCYFTGSNDPYKRLKSALKADIDEEAWESLYQTVSRPFPKPDTGRIAVKVINDYGDEVMKVFEV